jgi:hypothetical protein
MRILALAFLIAGLHFPFCLHAQARDATRWQSFEMPAGRYKAAFPAEPVMQQGKLRTEIGEVVSTRHTADSADATYDVTYNDYPKDGIARLSAAQLMDTVRDGLIYQSKGRLVSEKPFIFGKLAGREHEIAGEDGMRYRIRLLVVSNRLYQLTAMARPPAQPEARKFFDSFQLTGPASAQGASRPAM